MWIQKHARFFDKCTHVTLHHTSARRFSVKFPAVRAATGTYSRTRVEHAPTTAVCFKCSVNSIGIGREKCVSIELLWFKMQCEFKNTRVSWQMHARHASPYVCAQRTHTHQYIPAYLDFFSMQLCKVLTMCISYSMPRRWRRWWAATPKTIVSQLEDKIYYF